LKVLSTGDKTERAEYLYAQQITCYPRQATAVFRFKMSRFWQFQVIRQNGNLCFPNLEPDLDRTSIRHEPKSIPESIPESIPKSTPHPETQAFSLG